MADEERRTIRTVFGKELDLSEFEGIDVREVLAPVDQLRLLNKDPQYEYGWLDSNDPNTQVKIRRGVWEAVKASDLGGVDVPGITGSEDGLVHVRELLLVRMNKEKFDKIQKAYAAIALRREASVGEAFKAKAESIGQQVVPDASVEAYHEKAESVKAVERPWGQK